MESLLENLNGILQQIEKVQGLIDSGKEINFLQLKATCYQISILKESIEKSIYKTTRMDAHELVSSPHFQKIKAFFDKEIRPLSEASFKDPGFSGLLFTEMYPLLVSLKEVCHQLRVLFIEKKIDINYTDEYIQFKEDKKQASNKQLIEKVERSIEQYFLSEGEARGSTLAIIERSDPRLLHAHIPAPLNDYRLEYYYEKEKGIITFLRIARAKDLGYKGH